MKKPFALLTCFALSGCQMITETSETVGKTHYSDLWTSAEVASDESIHSRAPAPVNPDSDPNRIPTSKTESGNREYLFADSIKQDNGVITALVEYRYAQAQKLPSNGLSYTHNTWFEQIDCANKIRTVRTTTHYNAQGEIVDANEYPIPKLTPAQMKLLAQPDDGVIKEVCQRVGMNEPAAPNTATPPSNVPNAPVVAPPPAPNADAPQAVSASQAVAAPDANKAPQPENTSDKNTQNKRKKKEKIKATAKQQNTQTTETEKTDKQPNPAEIDFINQNKQNAPATQPEPENANQPNPQLVAPPQNSAPDVAPVQHDSLPDDFWTIGAPKEE